MDKIMRLSDLEEKLHNGFISLSKTGSTENPDTLALPAKHGTQYVGGFFAAVGFVGEIGLFGIILAAFGILILFALSHKNPVVDF